MGENQPRERRYRSDVRAVSLLLEIIIGLGLFSLAIVFTLGMFPNSGRSLTQAQELMQATTVARQVLETIVAQGYHYLPQAPGNYSPYLTDAVTEISSTRGNTFTLQFNYEVDVNVAYVPTSTTEKFKNVTVCVSWNDGALLRRIYVQDSLEPF